MPKVEIGDPNSIRPASMCGVCAHFNPDWTCAAFPNGIPKEILSGRIKHTTSFPGDDGIMFDAVTRPPLRELAARYRDPKAYERDLDRRKRWQADADASRAKLVANKERAAG